MARTPQEEAAARAATNRISKGLQGSHNGVVHVDPATYRKERHDRQRAAGWRRSPEMELLAEHAAAGANLTPSLRLQLGYYLEGKAATARQETDR